MITDPTRIAGLMTREVRTGERDGAPTRIVVARRTYPTTQEDLWDAVTTAERIPRWFLPVEGDLEVGGRYQLIGNAGGTVERCDPPASFATTWEMGPMVSWLQVALTPDGDGTALELTHEAPVDPDLWAQFGPGAVGLGWDLGLMALGLLVDSGEPVDREAGMAFSFSPEGIAFLQVASDGWAAAAVADGDDPEAARTAAATVLAMYTTAPE